jgi:hypothetical protein
MAEDYIQMMQLKRIAVEKSCRISMYKRNGSSLKTETMVQARWEKRKSKRNKYVKSTWVSLAVKTKKQSISSTPGSSRSPPVAKESGGGDGVMCAKIVECWIYQHFKLEKKPPFFFCGDVAADSDSEKRSFSDSLVIFGPGAD